MEVPDPASFHLEDDHIVSVYMDRLITNDQPPLLRIGILLVHYFNPRVANFEFVLPLHQILWLKKAILLCYFFVEFQDKVPQFTFKLIGQNVVYSIYINQAFDRTNFKSFVNVDLDLGN